MMATATTSNSSLAKKAEAAKTPATVSTEETVAQLIRRQQDQIALALPNSMDPSRFARIVITECKANPQLLACNPLSMLAAVMRAAQLGLEPGPLGHCYLVPFKDNKKNQLNVQFILGYKGVVNLARRSGEIDDIYAEVVYAGDTFDYELGLHRDLKHKRTSPANERTDKSITHAYGVAHFKGGGYAFVVLDRIEVEARRKRSKASDKGPWVTDYAAMAKKTAIRALQPWLPLSVEFLAAVQADGTAPIKLESIDLDALASAPIEELEEGDTEGGEQQGAIDAASTEVPPTPEPATTEATLTEVGKEEAQPAGDGTLPMDTKEPKATS
jgi:recombination protein RecT